jgi:hypothetical protein
MDVAESGEVLAIEETVVSDVRDLPEFVGPREPAHSISMLLVC